MRYLLDTNICIYISKRKPLSVLHRLERLRAGDAGMSVITYLELVYGAWNSTRVESNLRNIEALRLLIPVQPLDAAAGRHYGSIRASLRRTGRLIGAYDLLIAAHALTLGLVLVTSNVREFARIPGLRVEDWAE